MELWETVFEALKREMQEELTIHIKEENVELKYTTHRKFEDGREYIDFYFEISDYEWEIQIWEPDKCSDIQYISFERLEDIKLLRHDYIALENIEWGVSFAELYLKDLEY